MFKPNQKVLCLETIYDDEAGEERIMFEQGRVYITSDLTEQGSLWIDCPDTGYSTCLVRRHMPTFNSSSFRPIQVNAPDLTVEVGPFGKEKQ